MATLVGAACLSAAAALLSAFESAFLVCWALTAAVVALQVVAIARGPGQGGWSVLSIGMTCFGVLALVLGSPTVAFCLLFRDEAPSAGDRLTALTFVGAVLGLLASVVWVGVARRSASMASVVALASCVGLLLAAALFQAYAVG